MAKNLSRSKITWEKGEKKNKKREKDYLQGSLGSSASTTHLASPVTDVLGLPC
jgi:hypothetical protein